MSDDADKLCVLNNVLWVPSEHVDSEVEEEFTYRFEEVEYQAQTDLPAQCSNCDLWGKKWRPGRVTCADKGYTLDDRCKDFEHKKLPVVKEIVLKTYSKRPDGWTTFARGDMGKIKRIFGPLGIEDERVRPKLGFKLKCHRALYPEQQTVADAWLEKGYGIVQAPTGWGKCLGRGTPVMKHDGSVVSVETIVAGDLLMGPDSAPRRVVSTCTGREQMYRITPTKGDPYVVNESHILSLKISKSKRSDEVTVVNISVRDYLAKSKWFRHRAKGWRAPVDFASAPSLPMPPYILGLWLGDGTSLLPAVTSNDNEVVTVLETYAASLGMSLRKEMAEGKCPVYHVTGGVGNKKNPMLDQLRELGVYGDKHIPHAYLTSSKTDRLEILAGLIDSDGHLKDGGGYDFISRSERLADGVCFIARSLGFAAYKKACTKTCANNGVTGNYFRVGISGDCALIPCRIGRKKTVGPRLQKKDPLVVGIRVEPIGVDDYFGFELEGPDRLFLLGDFTVTHNTVLWAWLVAKMGYRVILLAQEVRHLMVGFEGLYEHTNIAELEEQAGEHLIGVINKDWKWAKNKKGDTVRRWLDRPGKYYPITFATFQSLASKRGVKLRKELTNYFGVVWCEEAHHESAPTFHGATRSFNAFYRGGQTATPSRKDQTHVAIFDTLGPVTARGRKEQMNPIVKYHATNIHVPDRVFKGKYILPQLVNFLARNAHYQECLYEEVLKECEEGRKILVVTERRNQAFRLQQKLKLQGFGCELMIGGEELKEQNWYAEELLSGRVSVIIGTQVINENVNIPPLDSIHQPFPNFGKEREEQRVGRVRRYLSGSNIEYLKAHGIDWEKPQPRVHIYTWYSRHGMAGSAVGFRDQLYKKWGFDFEKTEEAPTPSEPRPKTMKEWLESFKDD